MARDDHSDGLDGRNQISTAEIAASTAVGVPIGDPVADLGGALPVGAPVGDAAGAAGHPHPLPGLKSSPDTLDEQRNQPGSGTGIEGEEPVWEGRYSLKNFAGRFTVAAALIAGWIALAIYTWEYNHLNYRVLTGIAGIILVGYLLFLTYRIIMARYGHYYRLTSRRLFVSTGLFDRRRDQIELLKINDVFTRQTLAQRLLNVGTVVVVSSEPAFPTLYLVGVTSPKLVMDQVWHQARSERDQRSVKIDRVG